jgi:DNA invertase Pin-like site-specific DNA recombinase
LARRRNASRPALPGPGGTAYLTPRQAEALEWAAHGMGYKQIAFHLGISRRTVEDLFGEMRRRTGARTRAQLIACAVSAGLVQPGPDIFRGACQPEPDQSRRPAQPPGRARRTAPRRPMNRHPAEPTAGATAGPMIEPVTDLAKLGLNGTRICPTNVLPDRRVHYPADGRFPSDDETVPGAGDPGGAAEAAQWPVPDPAQPSGTRIGYARGPAGGHSLGRQLAALNEAGCVQVFADRQPGRATAQPELTACLDCLRPGDTLIVPSLDRPSRSLSDLVILVAQLRQRGVGFMSLHERLDTTTPGGRLIFHVFAALAEFIRELIAEHTRAGLRAARDGGQRLGRPPALSPMQVRHARELLTEPGNTVASIARLLKVSRSTIYKYVPEITSGEPPAGPPPAPDARRQDELLPSRRRR